MCLCNKRAAASVVCDVVRQVDEAEAVDVQVEDSRVWVPAEEPVVNPDFLLDSKIWEICQQMPIHWIHPSPMTGESRGHICL